MTRDVPSRDMPIPEPAITKTAVPRLTNIWVRNPAGLCAFSRWKPTIAPSSMAAIRRIITRINCRLSGNPADSSSQKISIFIPSSSANHSLYSSSLLLRINAVVYETLKTCSIHFAVLSADIGLVCLEHSYCSRASFNSLVTHCFQGVQVVHQQNYAKLLSHGLKPHRCFLRYSPCRVFQGIPIVA